MAKLLESQGDMSQALQYYSRAVDITPELYVPLIKRLLSRDIRYIVAPYEADAELAYLSRNHLVDFDYWGQWSASFGLWTSGF